MASAELVERGPSPETESRARCKQLDEAPPQASLSAYLFDLTGLLVTYSNAMVAPDTPMPQIGARMPHTTRDTAQYDRSYARCTLEPEVVGRTADKSLSDKTVLAWRC